MRLARTAGLLDLIGWTENDDRDQITLDSHAYLNLAIAILRDEAAAQGLTIRGIFSGLEAVQATTTVERASAAPDEIAAMLDVVPDTHEALKTASDQQLADIFGAFDVTISYDKTSQKLDLAATITPELLPQNDNDHSGERSRVLVIAGERFAPNGNLTVLVERTFPGWPGP